MKKSPLFLGLAFIAIHSISNACEDGNFYRDGENILPVASTVEVVVCDEVPQDNSSTHGLHEIFQECYRNNNARACHEIIAFVEKKALVDKLILLNELHSKQHELDNKQHTIDTQRETIDVFNALNRRRNERINKRKEEREKELSSQLNNHN